MKEKENSNKHNEKDHTIPVVTFLHRDEVDYLDKIGKDCFFKFGHKVSRAKILSELVDLLMHLKINIEDIDFEHETLWKSIARLIKNGTHAKM